MNFLTLSKKATSSGEARVWGAPLGRARDVSPSSPEGLSALWACFCFCGFSDASRSTHSLTALCISLSAPSLLLCATARILYILAAPLLVRHLLRDKRWCARGGLHERAEAHAGEATGPVLWEELLELVQEVRSIVEELGHLFVYLSSGASRG